MEKEITYYGLDVSKSTIQITSQHKLNGLWKETLIDNTIEAVNNWLSTISISESWFIFEYTGTYSQRLAYCLNLQEANFSILNPNQSKGFSLTLKKTSKTDRGGGPQTRRSFIGFIWSKNATIKHHFTR